MAAPDYAEFLHEEGYSAEASPQGAQLEHKRFKFFVFSRIEQRGKRIAQGRQWLSPQTVEWRVASPIEEQMELLAAGLANLFLVLSPEEARMLPRGGTQKVASKDAMRLAISL